ncbi:MAG: YjbQ family protein [Oligoflexia bacterium]|nr:YjbQ family protein [Oligoflexia bacterium]
MHQHALTLGPLPRGLTDVTRPVASIVARSGVQTGLCHVFIHHTSASLVVQENADHDVQRDLEAFLSRLVPDGDPLFRHVDEGPDDMSAHVKAALTASSLTIPVIAGRLGLGTWQGLYLWEHREAAGLRRLTVTVLG